MAEIADELRGLAKPTKILAGVGPNGVVYRTDRHPNEKLLKRAADALDALDARIAELLAALRNVRGYMADVAVAGMLIGADQAETHTRVSAHGIAMLKIVDVALSSNLLNKEDRNG